MVWFGTVWCSDAKRPCEGLAHSKGLEYIMTG